MAETGSDKTEHSEAKKPSFLMQIIGVVIITVLAAGAAGGSAFYLVKQAKLAPPAQAPANAAKDNGTKMAAGKEPAQEPPAKEASPVSATPEELTSLPIPVVLTNLTDPPSVFIRLESEMIIDAKSAKTSTALAAEISGDYMAFLHSLSVASFEGPSSFIQLKEDLTDRAQSRSKGLVREVIIRGLVVK